MPRIAAALPRCTAIATLWIRYTGELGVLCGAMSNVSEQRSCVRSKHPEGLNCSRSEDMGPLHMSILLPLSVLSICKSYIYIIGASVSEAPSCGLNGRAVTIDIDRRAYVHRYCACAALRANVAGQIGNRFSPAESAFLVPSATSLTLAP